MSDSRGIGRGRWRFLTALVVAVASGTVCRGWSAESSSEATVSLRAPPGKFLVEPGFNLEQVAAEPLVGSPVALAFDENGRLFVVERGPGAAGGGALGRVRVLQDTNGTGEFRHSTIYTDNLPWASAVACYGGGVFIAAGPDILFLRDSRTNGIADERRVVFSGFGSTNGISARTLVNNFNWGLDNRIHAATAGTAGFALAPSTPGEGPVSLTDREFSFDPRSLSVVPESGPAKSGLSFDNYGRKFVCDFKRPLRMPMYEPRYMARNPFSLAPPEMADVASPATVVFRLAAAGSAQPAGITSGPPSAVESPLKRVPVPTWLTNAQGCVIYRGNTFPSSYLGNAFIPDPSAHVIHYAVLREAGLELTATRPLEDRDREFVASRDATFCPVQIINGPDGAVYVADSGGGVRGGHIYRIVPVSFKRPSLPRLGRARTSGLVTALGSANGWERDTAARLLYERHDPAAAALLRPILANSRSPLGRLHALYALDGLGALRPADLQLALRDSDEWVRTHAVRLCETLTHNGNIPNELWNPLRLLAADRSVHVRYQVAWTLGEIRRPDRALVLADVIWHDPSDPWIRAAVLSSVIEGAGDLFVTLARDQRVRGSPVGQGWLEGLATMIGIKGPPEEVAQVLGFASQPQLTQEQSFPLLFALGDGLHRARSSLAQMDTQNQLQVVYAQVLNAVTDHSVPDPVLIGGLEMLSVGPYNYTNSGDLVQFYLGSGRSEAVQSAALATLARYDDTRITQALLQRGRVLTPRLRREACTAMLAWTNRIADVLTALETGALSRAELSSAQVDFLRTLREPALRERAVRLFGLVPGERPDAVQRFRPALALPGKALNGQPIFQARCAACHQSGGPRLEMSADLVAARVYGKASILSAILEPNVRVRQDYPTCVVETPDGEVLLGMLTGENAATITLQQLDGGSKVWPRDNIQYLQPQSWSVMPDGLEAGLTPQQMAELLEYVVRPTATP